jgi:phenylalanyl-tRNA synthetase beta chain
MKFSESWLREWVNPAITRENLSDQLSMAGLEIDGMDPAAGFFSGVVIGKIVQIDKHPEAERLNICQVDVGSSAALTIVCGAANARLNLKVAAALQGATLKNNLVIKDTKLRGVMSHGMLCSAKELGLKDDSDGLLELAEDAPVGEQLWDYLALNDFIFEVSITPNRGDCLSIMGLAKEVVALTECSLTVPTIQQIPAVTDATLPVTVVSIKECPCYIGRVITDINIAAPTPVWLSEKLRRGAVRSINPVVDVMNYIMLELGQPMHAFDLQTIQGGITVRKSIAAEKLVLLDTNEVILDTDTLVIADHEKPLAIAGVMGGLDSAVSDNTQSVFLESAFFQAASVVHSARKYHLSSDSCFRFERGIDPTIQRLAIERATELLLAIVGGKAGPVIEVSTHESMPVPAVILLRESRIAKILGYSVPKPVVEHIFSRLGFSVQDDPVGWLVTVPSRRSDISLEVDLIEEIARLYGYNNIPSSVQSSSLNMHAQAESTVHLSRMRTVLCDQGFHEVITYSFIDKHLQELFNPGIASKELLNPMTSEMSVMRASIWPGLVNTLLYNQNRQQARVRIFESGLRFLVNDSQLVQQRVLSGLICGPVIPEQWGEKSRSADFFDLKSTVESILKLSFEPKRYCFEAAHHPALHPGQTAKLVKDGIKVGLLGALHPSIAQQLKIDGKVFVFDLILDKIENSVVPESCLISKFPEIRRDIAFVVSETIPFGLIQDTISEVGGELLKQVDIFDFYQGKGIPAGFKSLALALTLQHSSRTLVDDEVIDLINRVMVVLKGRFNAELRG